MMLLRAREAVTRAFRPHLRDHGVTDQQWRILRALADMGQVELLELSRRCMIQPPSLSRTVPALVERGLVFREEHPSDRRRTLVALTDDGMELFRVIAAESVRIYRGLVACIGEEELEELYGMLTHVIEGVESAFETTGSEEEMQL